jgi:hypothetical protein
MDEHDYKCSWRTASTWPQVFSGEITVKAGKLADALEVARYRIGLKHDLPREAIVVHEVEEDFL